MNDDDDTTQREIGWFRALVTGAIIVLCGVAALVYGTNAILTKIHGKTRGSLVAVATIWFFVAFVALAWGLRRLQARKTI